MDESESVVQGCAALGAGFEIRGHALPVAAVERGAQQRRPKALTLEAVLASIQHMTESFHVSAGQVLDLNVVSVN